MKQDETNAKVLAQLQEYAQLYFMAIIEANTKDGKCDLKPGKYSAKELTDNSYKSALGRAWELPCDSMFDEVLTVEAGTFQCAFPYRRIFEILTKWEAMTRAGKQKAVFEIGNVEIISAKVLTDEKTKLGAYKEKRIKLQRLHGNWYAAARIKRNACNVDIYYKHEKLIFCGGQMSVDMLDDKNRELLIMRLDKAENSLIKSLLQLAAHKEYFAEVCKRMNIEAQQPATAAETPQISTEATEAVNISAEGEEEPKMAETSQSKPYYSHRHKVLHNCDLKSWDDFHRKNKNAILVFHHGASYTALQKEAARVSTLCGASYAVNRYGTEVCQFGEAALTQIIKQGTYVAIIELTQEPEYGISQPPYRPNPPHNRAKHHQRATMPPRHRNAAREYGNGQKRRHGGINTTRHKKRLSRQYTAASFYRRREYAPRQTRHHVGQLYCPR